MGKRSNEFYEGFNSIRYYNPYPSASLEYNEFERGWSKRLKQGYPVSGSKFEDEPVSALTLFKPQSKKVNIASDKKKSFNELLGQYGLKK